MNQEAVKHELGDTIIDMSIVGMNKNDHLDAKITDTITIKKYTNTKKEKWYNQVIMDTDT